MTHLTTCNTHNTQRTQGFASIDKPPPGSALHTLLLHGCGELLRWAGRPSREMVNELHLAPDAAAAAWRALPRPLMLVAAAEVAEGLLLPG